MTGFRLRHLPVWFVLVLVSTASVAQASSRRIAITFDDAPRAAGPFMDAESRTSLLVSSLEKAGINGAMFFATTRNTDTAGEEGDARLRRYADAGHVIANHSHRHASANGMSAEDFLADVELAQSRLQSYAGNAPYFRFPFLHEGDSPEKRDAIRKGLVELGLEQGYVTIDNYDWYLQQLFDEAVQSERPLNLDDWKAAYVEVLKAAATFYDDLAVDVLGRSPAHVLLLHENDLAALFIDDLVAALRADGWEVIPALEAYADPIAGETPDTMFLGQGRVAALARVAGRPAVALRHPWESEAALRALLVSRGMVGLADGAYLNAEPPGIVPRKFAPGVVSRDDRYEYGTALSADGRELYFGVAVDGRGEIWTSRFVDGEWTAPEVILVHPESSFADPFLSADETRLYFISTRPAPDSDASGNYDIWYLRRTRGGWSEPRHLGAPVNTEANEYYVSFTDDGTLAFASNRHEPDGTNYDIYLTSASDGVFDVPQVLEGRATTRAYEADPFIAPDGRYILFSSTRRSGEGRRDLYVTFRLEDGSWSRAISLGKRVNTPGIEFCPSVTRDGRFLFYTSNEDIYWVDAAVLDIAREALDEAMASR